MKSPSYAAKALSVPNKLRRRLADPRCLLSRAESGPSRRETRRYRFQVRHLIQAWLDPPIFSLTSRAWQCVCHSRDRSRAF
jgi:hypothetical protein